MGTDAINQENSETEQDQPYDEALIVILESHSSIMQHLLIQKIAPGIPERGIHPP